MVILCIYFVVVFLFKVGFIEDVTNQYSGFITLSLLPRANSSIDLLDLNTQAKLYEAYVPEQDIYGAIWLHRMSGNDSTIYADLTSSKHVLQAYGMTTVRWEYLLHNISNTTIRSDAYIYLRTLNVRGLYREGGEKSQFSVTANISSKWEATNLVYSNGDCEVYRSLPSR